MLYFFFYVLIIAIIWYSNKKVSFSTIFRTTKKTNWFVAGLSLFMLLASVDNAQLYSGIIHKQGVWGLWLLWVTYISVAVVPIVFAPLWAKMNFITDNQFILFRFSGIGAKILHQFRAIYVGGIIVAFALSFQTIAFSRILQVFFELNQVQSIIITGGLLCMFSLKNTFVTKFKTDVFHSIIYFLSVIVVFYFLSQFTGGLSTVIDNIKISSPETLSIFPGDDNHTFWYAIAVYLGVQWWSATMFDGGGAEMSRYTAVGTRWGAIKVGLLPIVINIIIVTSLVALALFSFQMGKPSGDEEMAIIENILIAVPQSFIPFIVLGFFALFISTSESMLNWGASFLTVDFYQTYVAKHKTSEHYSRFSLMVMLMVSFLSLIAALYIDSLESLIKIVFSISAGVTPVFILRWFWMRINAWSQLAAMLASGIYTLLFYALQTHFQHLIDDSVLQSYEWRMLIVTFLTTITWLLITFLTPKDDQQTIARFREILPPKKEIITSFAIAFSIGIMVIITLVFIVYLIVR